MRVIFPGHGDHDMATYVPASVSGPYRRALTVGAGITVTENHSPRIYVHIVDNDRVDEDAYLTIDQAVDLIDALIAAIAVGRSVPTC